MLPLPLLLLLFPLLLLPGVLDDTSRAGAGGAAACALGRTTSPLLLLESPLIALHALRFMWRLLGLLALVLLLLLLLLLTDLESPKLQGKLWFAAANLRECLMCGTCFLVCIPCCCHACSCCSAVNCSCCMHCRKPDVGRQMSLLLQCKCKSVGCPRPV